ncbi:uncharacterized protein LOC115621875 [Scaptodrosophila lebanonensis]|uniref:Uncharacterized protein LOC115621875 n=1 Tax=Drosophila lebanonensis TaxID=7225 RepID=A0A6J2T3T2_DROLE|nr:uncharacterized protein LOC115621875 [Scaptodrosophila lebanonensis]
MHALIVLSLLAAAQADVGGYNYAAGTSSGNIGGSSLSGGSLSSDSLSGDTLSSGSSGGSLDSSSSGEYAPIDTEFNKEFFTYSAPEADFEDTKSVGDLAASLKKNLRVVFIRSPENKGLENAALALAKQASEQQTAIYVLTKQGDLSSLANKLQNLNHVSASKPEVHFVKYRTPQDAINAQRTIQQEYDRLGGSSQSHNGGIAPVLDFTSKQVQQPRQQQQHQQFLQSAPFSLSATDGRISSTGVAGELEASAAYIPPPPPDTPQATYLPVQKVK